MSQEERFGSRDRTYSAWHRRMSTRRFVGIERAQTLAMIDLDASLYVEAQDGVFEPLALIETARDMGQRIKPSTLTRNLARRCTPVLPAYTLLYTPSNTANPADTEWPDIASFRARRLWPNPMDEWKTFTPEGWAKFLVVLREKSAALLDDAFNAALPWRPMAEMWADVVGSMPRR